MLWEVIDITTTIFYDQAQIRKLDVMMFGAEAPQFLCLEQTTHMCQFYDTELTHMKFIVKVRNRW